MPDPTMAIVGSSVGSGIANIIGSGKASKAQLQATQMATATQLAMQEKGMGFLRRMFDEGKEALSPYLDVGKVGADELTRRLPDLTAPIMMDQETLEKTPGYEWLMKQGMRAVTGQNVLRGLSGAQIKGGAEFVKGLADTTYKDQYAIARQNKMDAFNRLFQTAELGRGAGAAVLSGAASIGGAGAGSYNTLGTNIGNNLISGGNAQAAGQLGMWSNIGNMFNSIPAAMVFNKLYGGGNPTPAAPTGMYGSPSGAYPGYGDYTY